MTIQADNTVVYSGPSIKYRPIVILGKGTTLIASNKIVSEGDNGDYYRVLIRGKGRKKRIGYISTSSMVTLDRSSDSEDLDKYKPLKLARSAVQGSVQYLRKETYIWQAGYLKYPAPGFYLKGFGGQIFNNTDQSYIFGVESGNDSLIDGPYSAYASVALGLAMPSSDDSPFTGAKSATSFYVSGSVGGRYNAAEHASFSIGLGSVSIFNKNNSFVSIALMTTFEVGL